MPQAPLLLLSLAVVSLSLATTVVGLDVVWEDGPADWPCGGVSFVFGVPVCATPNALLGSRAKRDHVVNVLHQLLDNDEDGDPDDPAVLAEMADRGAILVVAGTESDFEGWAEGVPESMVQKFGYAIMTGLFEAFPNSCDVPVNRGASATNRSTWPGAVDTDGMSCTNERDATVEEALHLLTEAAAEVYPSKWAADFSSEAGAALTAANGDCGWGYTGDWKDPSGGGCSGTYAYGDRTCDEACLVAEGVYWAIVSYVGGLYTRRRALFASDEWLMATPDASMGLEPPGAGNAISLEEGSPALYALVSDTTSEGHAWLPEVMPDGRYRGEPSPASPILGCADCGGGADHPPPAAPQDLECAVVGEWCDRNAPHFDPQGAVCANDGRHDEAYCNYSFGPSACVIGCRTSGADDAVPVIMRDEADAQGEEAVSEEAEPNKAAGDDTMGDEAMVDDANDALVKEAVGDEAMGGKDDDTLVKETIGRETLGDKADPTEAVGHKANEAGKKIAPYIGKFPAVALLFLLVKFCLL